MSKTQHNFIQSKRFRVFAGGAWALSSLLLACGGEAPNATPADADDGSSEGVGGAGGAAPNYGELSVVDGRLRFAARDAVLETLSQLDEEATLDTEGGQGTFERFEKSFGFSSLRQKTAAVELAAEEVEYDTDDTDMHAPSEVDFVSWEALRSLLNADHQIQIGDDVLTLLDDERMVSIPASDKTALAALLGDLDHPSNYGAILNRATGAVIEERTATGTPKKAEKWSTTTLTLQPDAAAGQDADVFSLPSAIDTNRGDIGTASAMAWTWDGTAATMRSYLRFDISAVPSSKTIKRATLTLAGPATGQNATEHSTLSGPNNGWLKRVLAPWNEQTITWNNQPASAATGIALAASTGPGQTYAVDVTSLINEIRDSGQNYGMMLQLQNEQAYRALVFYSSDAAQPSVRPKLEIEFGENTCGIDFQATTTGLDVAFIPTPTGKSPYSYSWDFGDGSVASSMAPMHTYASAGPYNVCVTATDGDACTTTPVCKTVSPSGTPPCCREASQAQEIREFHNGDRRLIGNLDMEHFFGWHLEAKATHEWKDWNRKKSKFKWKRDKAQRISAKVNTGKLRSWKDSVNACRGDYVDVSEQTVAHGNDSLVRAKSTIYGALTFQKVGIEHNGVSASFHAEEHGFKTDFKVYLGGGCPRR